MAVDIKYKGDIVATAESGQTATLKCGGYKMGGDVEVTAYGGDINAQTVYVTVTYNTEGGEHTVSKTPAELTEAYKLGQTIIATFKTSEGVTVGASVMSPRGDTMLIAEVRDTTHLYRAIVVCPTPSVPDSGGIAISRVDIPGGSAEGAVLYIPQDLTEEQKAQARENIGVGKPEKSVTDYGAKGDGVTDDTEAFNAALKDAAGKCLHVPAGKYLITSTLYIHDGTTLYGDGYGSQIQTKVADGFVFNGVSSSGAVSTMVKTVIMYGLYFTNKLQQDSVTKLQPGNFIDRFRGSTMRDCRVTHYYQVFRIVETLCTLAHNRFSYVYHCFCVSTTDSLIDGNYINASVYGNPHGSRCFESSCNSLTFSNNFVDYFRDFLITKNTTASKFVGNTFSRMVSVFHDTLQGFTVTGNTFNFITYVASDWKALTAEQREQLANETWSVIKFDNEFIKTAHHMRNVTFANNVSIKPVDNYIYIADKSVVYPANCDFRDNTFTTDHVTPSGVKAHFINYPRLDRYNLMKNVYFDFWDMKEYAELPNPVTRSPKSQPIVAFPYMRAVYKNNIYINIHDSWQKETHIGGRFTATGEVLDLTDTTTDKLQGLVLYGKSTQDGAPTLETPVPIVSSGDDGAVDVVITEKNLSGGQAWRDILVNDMSGVYDEEAGTVTTRPSEMSGVKLFGNFAPKTQYTIILSGYNTTDSQRTSNLVLKYKDGSIAYLSFPNYGPTKGTKAIVSKVGGSIDGIYGSNGGGKTVLFPYECGIFKGEITLEDFKAYTAQTMSISTPNGLRGIPVTSGGNYTDADGQQWICDEIDLSSGVMVQNVGKIENYAGETIHGAWMSSTGELSEGATVLYDLYALPEVEEGEEVEEVEPIETPLPEEAIAAYAELHTYRRDTNIYSNDKAGITVDYLVAGHDGVDWSLEDIALGVHSDGKLYIFIDGKPVGNGVALGQQ